MKVAVISLVLFGLLAAGSAAVLVTALTRPSNARIAIATTKQESQAEVLVAAHDLQPMGIVDAAGVTTRKVARSQVPDGALLNPVQVVGKVLTFGMVAGQPFTKACFARDGAGVYLASAVPPGKRAMSISLTDWSGMAGLLYPGSVVDVLASFKSASGAGQRDGDIASTVLLQGLQVLAIGSQSIADAQYKDKQVGALAQHGEINTRMVTLLVDPKQAEILQLATQSGSISLTMRNPLDKINEPRRVTHVDEIRPDSGPAGIVTSDSGRTDPFAGAPERLAADPSTTPTPANEWQTIIIRGHETQTRTFPMPNRPTAAEAGHSPSTRPTADSLQPGSLGAL